ncbi:MAG: NPCBM/NEW2 domain-containing protein [Planctomycetota bacterium]
MTTSPPRPSRRLAAAPICSFVLLLTTSLAPAQGSGANGTATTVDGRSLSGALTVGDDGKARLQTDAGVVDLDFAELQSFERADAGARNVQVEDRVWLRSGQELPAKKLSGRAATADASAMLVVTLPSGIALEVPVSMLAALRHGGTMRPQPRLFAEDLANPPANEDLIYVQKNGSSARSSVIVTGIGDKKIDFLLRNESYEFELDGLAAVVFGASTGFAPDRQPRPRTIVALTTGERVEGRLLSLGEQVRLRLDEGCVLEAPVAKLHRLEVSSDRLVWLTELQPQVEQTPAFDRVWPWHQNRSTAGPGFELAGVHFERGLGMVPRTRLTYDLDARFDQFEAMIGIDDRGGPEAHAIFRVFVDGKLAYESQPKTRGLAAEAVQVPLQRAKTLALEVDFGKNYDLGDFCAFANARVIQK